MTDWLPNPALSTTAALCDLRWSGPHPDVGWGSDGHRLVELACAEAGGERGPLRRGLTWATQAPDTGHLPPAAEFDTGVLKSARGNPSVELGGHDDDARIQAAT